jgi:heat shock protein HslJ
MKLRFVVLLVVALFAFPALAQDNATHTVTFDGFSFSYDSSIAPNVNITLFAGDPPDLEQPGGPEVAHTQFSFYSQPPAPESLLDSAGGIRIYNTADFAGYDFPAQRLQQLQTLLAERPDLASYMQVDTTQENALPFMPVFPAVQVLRARAQFVDTASLSGISYVTVYSQGVSPFVGSDFFYTFQGISADGAHYISVIIRLNTALFPEEIPADFDYEEFSATFDQYLSDSVATLNNASPDDFTPSLTTLDAFVKSFAFTGTGGVTPAPQTPQATPTAVLDPTLGGLAGTWTLVSYGDPANPQAVLPNAPVTLAFAPDGVSGTVGCNQFGGASFQYENGALTFGEIITTRMACAEDVMAQENAFLTAIQSAASFQVTEGQLQIFYDGGVLNFIAAGSVLPEATVSAGGDPTLGGLAGTWTLVSYGDPNNPQPVVGSTPITLTLALDSVSGNAGCNQYGAATFQYENNTLWFGQIISTLVACADAAAMAQETVYLTALQSATSFQITDGQLQIFYDGGVLTFTAA